MEDSKLVGKPHSEENAIEIMHLSRKFGDISAVNGIDLNIKKGRIMGFIGPNGAGKTTTMRMLTCLLRPTSGTAKVAGFDICKNPLEVKARIGYVPDELNLYERLTGLEHLYFVGRMFGIDESKLVYRIPILLDIFELTEKKDTMVIEYSHGMQKKIAFACALVHDPEILFLDEPFSGLDPISSKLCRALLRALSNDGMTIFLSSHDLELIEKICDEFAIINKGRLVVSGKTEDIKNVNIRDEKGIKKDCRLEDIFMEHVNASIPRDLLSWKK